jgi:hypothetical protein
LTSLWFFQQIGFATKSPANLRERFDRVRHRRYPDSDHGHGKAGLQASPITDIILLAAPEAPLSFFK